MAGRRHFLSVTARGIGLSVVGAIVWAGYVEDVVSAPLILRPPAALKENNFLRACIKCGLCVEACPYDALLTAGPGDHKPMGTPYFLPRKTPCHMCPDIPCLPVCPTGALSPYLVTAKGNKAPDINEARMGVAVIDRESCIASRGVQCDVCYRACPLLGKAITIDFVRNRRIGKYAKLLPIVHPDKCTGCGMCEHACVTERASIFVLPARIAKQGRAGDLYSYVQGGKQLDQERIKPSDITTLKTTTERSMKKALDYLNEGMPHE